MTERLTGAPGEHGSFGVPSASTPGHVWAVEWRTSEIAWCACPACAREGRCRHIDAVTALVREERLERGYPVHDPAPAPAPVPPAWVDLSLREIEEIFSR